MQTQPAPPPSIVSAHERPGIETAAGQHGDHSGKKKSVLRKVKERAKKFKEKITSKSATLPGSAAAEHEESGSDYEAEGDQSPPSQEHRGGPPNHGKAGEADRDNRGDKFECPSAPETATVQDSLDRFNCARQYDNKSNMEEESTAAGADDKPHEKTQPRIEEFEEQRQHGSAPAQPMDNRGGQFFEPTSSAHEETLSTGARGHDGKPAFQTCESGQETPSKNTIMLDTSEPRRDESAGDIADASRDVRPQGSSFADPQLGASKEAIIKDESEPQRDVRGVDLVSATKDESTGGEQSILIEKEEDGEDLPVSDHEVAFYSPSSDLGNKDFGDFTADKDEEDCAESDRIPPPDPVEAYQYHDAEGEKASIDQSVEASAAVKDTAAGAAAGSAAGVIDYEPRAQGEEKGDRDEHEPCITPTHKEDGIGVPGPEIGYGGKEVDPEVYDGREVPITSGKAEEEQRFAHEFDTTNDEQLAAGENKPSISTRAVDTAKGLKETIFSTFGYGSSSPSDQPKEKSDAAKDDRQFQTEDHVNAKRPKDVNLPTQSTGDQGYKHESDLPAQDSTPSGLKGDQPGDVYTPVQIKADRTEESALPAYELPQKNEEPSAPLEEETTASVRTNGSIQERESKDARLQKESEGHLEVSATDISDASTDEIVGRGPSRDPIVQDESEPQRKLPASDQIDAPRKVVMEEQNATGLQEEASRKQSEVSTKDLVDAPRDVNTGEEKLPCPLTDEETDKRGETLLPISDQEGDSHPPSDMGGKELDKVISDGKQGGRDKGDQILPSELLEANRYKDAENENADRDRAIEGETAIRESAGKDDEGDRMPFSEPVKTEDSAIRDMISGAPVGNLGFEGRGKGGEEIVQREDGEDISSKAEESKALEEGEGDANRLIKRSFEDLTADGDKKEQLPADVFDTKYSPVASDIASKTEPGPADGKEPLSADVLHTKDSPVASGVASEEEPCPANKFRSEGGDRKGILDNVPVYAGEEQEQHHADVLPDSKDTPVASGYLAEEPQEGGDDKPLLEGTLKDSTADQRVGKDELLKEEESKTSKVEGDDKPSLIEKTLGELPSDERHSGLPGSETDDGGKEVESEVLNGRKHHEQTPADVLDTEETPVTSGDAGEEKPRPADEFQPEEPNRKETPHDRKEIPDVVRGKTCEEQEQSPSDVLPDEQATPVAFEYAAEGESLPADEFHPDGGDRKEISDVSEYAAADKQKQLSTDVVPENEETPVASEYAAERQPRSADEFQTNRGDGKEIPDVVPAYGEAPNRQDIPDVVPSSVEEEREQAPEDVLDIKETPVASEYAAEEERRAADEFRLEKPDAEDIPDVVPGYNTGQQPPPDMPDTKESPVASGDAVADKERRPEDQLHPQGHDRKEIPDVVPEHGGGEEQQLTNVLETKVTPAAPQYGGAEEERPPADERHPEVCATKESPVAPEHAGEGQQPPADDHHLSTEEDKPSVKTGLWGLKETLASKLGFSSSPTPPEPKQEVGVARHDEGQLQAADGEQHDSDPRQTTRKEIPDVAPGYAGEEQVLTSVLDTKETRPSSGYGAAEEEPPHAGECHPEVLDKNERPVAPEHGEEGQQRPADVRDITNDHYLSTEEGKPSVENGRGTSPTVLKETLASKLGFGSSPTPPEPKQELGDGGYDGEQVQAADRQQHEPDPRQTSPTMKSRVLGMFGLGPSKSPTPQTTEEDEARRREIEGHGNSEPKSVQGPHQ